MFMDDREIVDSLKYLHAEIEMLRARNDVLSIALKYAVTRGPHAHVVFGTIMHALNSTSVQALYSTVPSEAYLTAFDAAVEAVEKWRGALPPADG